MKNIIKFSSRVVSFVFALLVVMPFFFAPVKTFADEGKEITVFSVDDYIHEATEEGELGVLEMFEEETGIKVNYLTFATNEEMYNELKKDPNACDLVCPSEYMIMKLAEEEMIRKFETPNNFREYGSEYIKNVFKKYPLNIMDEDEGETYAVGYMWGTVGLIYSIDNMGENPEILTNWSGLWDKSLNGRVTIKDSIRDTYFIALAKVFEEELLSCKQKFEDGEYITTEDPTGIEGYNRDITEIVNRTDYASVQAVESELAILKQNLFGFEVDSGKSDILTGKIDVNLAWSGDAVYSIYQGLFDDDGNPLPNQVFLGYTIPEEGSNVWFDGYVMTKNADYDSSLLFLDFIARPDVAVLNMDFTGYTSCIAGDEVFEYVLDSYNDDESEVCVDLKYFFDPSYEGDDYVVRVSEDVEQIFFAQYPTEEEINRCAIMKNFSGEELVRINDMWKKTKLVTLTDLQIYLTLAGMLAVIGIVVVIKYREKIFGKKSFDVVEKKSKYKVIKREKLN